MLKKKVIKMCHKRGLRMVWNSVMRKKMGFSCVLSKRTSNDILSVFGNNGVAQNCMPKYLQEGEVCCGCSCFCRDKALLCKRENIGKYFHPAFTGFFKFISSDYGGSQIRFDVSRLLKVLPLMINS